MGSRTVSRVSTPSSYTSRFSQASHTSSLLEHYRRHPPARPTEQDIQYLRSHQAMSDKAFGDWVATKEEEGQQLAEEQIRQHAEEFQAFIAQHCRSAEQSDMNFKTWLKHKKSQNQRNGKAQTSLMQAYGERKPKPSTTQVKHSADFNLRTDKSLLPPTFDEYSKTKGRHPWSQEMDRSATGSPYAHGVNLSPTRR